MSSPSPVSAVAPLERDAIGLAPVLFQSITHMAPAAAVAFSIIFATTYAGGAAPPAPLFSLRAGLLVALHNWELGPPPSSAGGPFTDNAPRVQPPGRFLLGLGGTLAPARGW